MSRKIGIIESGIVGETLANGFVKQGYQVTIGTNTAGKRDGLRAKTNGRARARSNRSVFCGAFQASEAPAGRTRSSC